jgi:hypothetical protein
MDLRGLFAILYIGAVIGVFVFLLSLVYRLVRAHERGAEALEILARRFKDGGGN